MLGLTQKKLAQQKFKEEVQEQGLTPLLTNQKRDLGNGNLQTQRYLLKKQSSLQNPEDSLKLDPKGSK